MTDIEIAESANVKPIKEIAAKIGLSEDDISPYGKYIAKVPLNALDKLKDKEDGKLVMVTAITPTPAGEGKTVTTIGLIQGLGRLGKKGVNSDFISIHEEPPVILYIALLSLVPSLSVLL